MDILYIVYLFQSILDKALDKFNNLSIQCEYQNWVYLPQIIYDCKVHITLFLHYTIDLIRIRCIQLEKDHCMKYRNNGRVYMTLQSMTYINQLDMNLCMLNLLAKIILPYIANNLEPNYLKLNSTPSKNQFMGTETKGLLIYSFLYQLFQNFVEILYYIQN